MGVGENTVNSRVVGLKLGRPKKRGGDISLKDTERVRGGKCS